MPNEQYLMDEKNLPENWVESPASKGPLGAAAPPLPHDMPQYFSGSLSPQLQHDSSFVSTEIGSPRIPKYSLMPLGIQAVAFTNAAAQSTAQKVVEKSSVSLQTNGTPNSNQGVENLIAGNGISLTADGSGGTTIDSSGGSDGLVHGDPIWEYDSAYTNLRDEFLANNGTNIGELGWATQGAAAAVDWFSGASPNIGQILLWTNNTTNGSVSILALNRLITGQIPSGQNSNVASPLLDSPGWKQTMIFCVRRISPDDIFGTSFGLGASSLYIGLGTTTGNSWQTRPNTFIGLRYDTDLSDTTWNMECVFNNMSNGTSAVTNTNQGTFGGVFNTGITPTEFIMYRLEIAYLTANTIIMTLSGNGTKTSHTFSLTKPNATTVTQIIPGASGSAALQFSAANPGTPPGSLMTVSLNAFPGTYTCAGMNSGNNQIVIMPTSGTEIGPFKWAAYPGLIPFIGYSNAKAGSVFAIGTHCVALDYFSFVWNKGGLATGGGTPDPTKSRYW